MINSDEDVPPLTYVEVAFRSTTTSEGPSVVVPAALVDTGSSDGELRESLLRRIAPLATIAKAEVYETATGGKAYDVYEVEMTVLGRRCAAAVTVVSEERFQEEADEPCTDDATVGHVALAAMGLVVDPARQRIMLKELPSLSKYQFLHLQLYLH